MSSRRQAHSRRQAAQHDGVHKGHARQQVLSQEASASAARSHSLAGLQWARGLGRTKAFMWVGWSASSRRLSVLFWKGAGRPQAPGATARQW